jgi:hypothetical protein
MRISHNKESWEKVRKKGVKTYLLKAGILKLGIFLPLILLTYFYLSEIEYVINEFDFSEYIREYIVWVPLGLVLGVIVAGLAWVHNNDRFKAD